MVLRKNLVIEKKGQKVGEEVRYFFYITNEWDWERAEVVYFANDRCNQENLIEQLKNGVRALRAPSNTLVSNGAYMVIAALAWSLKAWLALLQPRPADRQALLTMEFKKFLAEVVLLPCQVRACAAGGWCTGCCNGTRGWICCAGRWRCCGDCVSLEAEQPKSRSGCLDPHWLRTQEREPSIITHKAENQQATAVDTLMLHPRSPCLKASDPGGKRLFWD